MPVNECPLPFASFVIEKLNLSNTFFFDALRGVSQWCPIGSGPFYDFTSTIDWFVSIISYFSDSNKVNRLVLVCWFIWRARNKFIFEDVKPSSFVVYDGAESLWLELTSSPDLPSPSPRSSLNPIGNATGFIF